MFTVNYVIPVTEYGHTSQMNLKKNVFPEVKTKIYPQFSLIVYIFDVRIETTIWARSVVT